MTRLTTVYVYIKILTARGLSAPAPGAIYMWKNIKMCIKSEFKEICLKLVLNVKVRLSELLCAVKTVEGNFRFCWKISPNVGQTHKENPNLIRIF